MYESFFQLAARPFLSSPLAERYYPAGAVERARETVVRCVERAEGPALILGPAGTGKSTLCQVIAQQLRDRFRVAMLASAQLCTRRALLQNILFELKLPYRDRDEGELRLSLIDALEPSDACPHGMLLIVDEAHMLPLRLLEEIRMITNLVRHGQPRVRLVLAASMILEERLASPRLESFNQRVAARCYLQSMRRDETCNYVRAQLLAVGGDPDTIFTSDALHAVHRATDGVPRLVNQVCDHVLLLAANGRRTQVTAASVEEAWADLQQLPTPWTSDNAEQNRPSDILEFGQLDDDTCGELDAGELPVEAEFAELPAVAAAPDSVEPQGPVPNDAADDEDPTPDDSDDADCQFRPQLCRSPETELVFHHAHNPFAERFAEEEVIVDPFTSLETLSGAWAGFPAKPNEDAPPATCGPTVAAAADGSAAPAAYVDSVEFDPVLPEEVEPMVESLPECPAPLDDAPPGDDRDLLEIVDDSPELPEEYALAIAAYRPRRRAYRQLFASLRGQ
ncbi:MAG: AAA family ATPase [Planctomycetaceae bacterium]|nr:AAA family ATPase [Planctomycetaceae bacterium]